MSSKTLCHLIRFAVIVSAACALFIALFIIPAWGQSLARANPELSGWYTPWLIFIWVASIPCFVILIFVCKVSGAIKNDEVFTIKTAKWVKTSAILLFSDAAFFFFGNVIFLLLKMSHPEILFLSMLGDIFAIALALLASVLSRYLTKAAELQDVSEGTI
jgi:hypothetical protein